MKRMELCCRRCFTPQSGANNSPTLFRFFNDEHDDVFDDDDDDGDDDDGVHDDVDDDDCDQSCEMSGLG